MFLKSFYFLFNINFFCNLFNQKSAHISRERKKKYVDGLEQRVEMTTKENEQLHKQIKSLKNENL